MNETPQQAARRLSAPALRDGFKPEKLHLYTDMEGSPLHWRIRLKHPDSGDKWIRPMKLNGEGYVLGEPEYPKGKPLYLLHDLASRPNDPVYVVEGEWCSDALIKRNILATTSGAADSAGKADWQPLAGRSVIVWPDNDDPGQRYAMEAAEQLRALGCEVRIIDVDALELPAKGDAVDWLVAHPESMAEDILSLPILVDTSASSGTSILDTHQTPPTKAGETDVEAIGRLAALPLLEYERVRESEAERLGVRVSVLDKQVGTARRAEETPGLDFEEVEPWAHPVDPATLLMDVAVIVQRFIVCQEETAHAVALWVAMTWFMDVVQVAPLAVITAPEKRCGKSQLLFLLGRLVQRPLAASNISSAAMFRAIDAWQPTLLVDEADSFMRENEELRGVINCGHTRDSAYIVRVVGDDHIPKKFNVWGAKAIAGIGHLADTLMDRAITLELRRKLPHEQVDRLRYAEPGLFDDLTAKLARFGDDCREAVRQSRPDLPECLNDRAQDNWEPLLAIAEVAGGLWPDLARKAALKLSGVDSPTMSIGTELLADIQEVFEAKRVERIRSTDLLAALCDDDERPWATYNRGKQMSPRQLSRKLAGYDIRSKNLKIGYGDVKKGFERSQFKEAFSRYLPLENTRYPLQANGDGGFTVADMNLVAATTIPSATSKPAPHKAGSGVADKWDGMGQGMVEVEI